MFKNQQHNEIEIQEQQDNENLLGFFRLLLEIDNRLHPENYKKPKNENND